MERSMVHLLEATAAAAPLREALRQGLEAIEFVTLWERVRAVCGFCRDQGIAGGEPVLIAMEGAIDYAAAWCGLLAAGAVAVPLHPESTHNELAEAIRVTGARWLFADAGVAEPALPGLRRVVIDRPGAPLPQGAIAWRALLASRRRPPDYARLEQPDAPAAIFFSAGSRADPRAVVLSHASLAAEVRAVRGVAPIGLDETGVCALPLHCVGGASVLGAHLAAGARLVVSGERMPVAGVMGTLECCQATGLYCAASTLYALLATDAFSGRRLAHLSAVTVMESGLRADAAEQTRRALPRLRLHQFHCQPESGGRLTWLPPELLSSKRGSAGVALPGVELAILDPGGGSLPTGSVGELCARGRQVMSGYLRNPGATQAALRGGWLHTGEMAWRDEEGFVYPIGREDDLIRSRWLRIAPAALEEVIAGHPEVAEVAVVGVPDALLGEAIRAVVVARPGRTPSAGSLLEFCRAQLPPHLLPHQILSVGRLPVGASGQVQRKLLIHLREGDHAAAHDFGCAV